MWVNFCVMLLSVKFSVLMMMIIVVSFVYVSWLCVLRIR